MCLMIVVLNWLGIMRKRIWQLGGGGKRQLGGDDELMMFIYNT